MKGSVIMKSWLSIAARSLFVLWIGNLVCGLGLCLDMIWGQLLPHNVSCLIAAILVLSVAAWTISSMIVLFAGCRNWKIKRMLISSILIFLFIVASITTPGRDAHVAALKDKMREAISESLRDGFDEEHPVIGWMCRKAGVFISDQYLEFLEIDSVGLCSIAYLRGTPDGRVPVSIGFLGKVFSDFIPYVANYDRPLVGVAVDTWEGKKCLKITNDSTDAKYSFEVYEALSGTNLTEKIELDANNQAVLAKVGKMASIANMFRSNGVKLVDWDCDVASNDVFKICFRRGDRKMKTARIKVLDSRVEAQWLDP